MEWHMSPLVADSFLRDQRVADAERLILDALREHQARIVAVRPPDPALKQPYDETINEFGELRGGPLFFPYLGSGIGNGPLVELADGSVKYDFISGIGVHHWGHSNLEIVEAALEAALSDTIHQGNLQQNTDSVDLCRLLVGAASARGARISRCFLSTSGATANENALKLVFQKKSPAHRLLAFEGCFAGRTLALSSVTDRPAYRVGIPTTLEVDYVPFYDPQRPEESIAGAVDELKRYLARYPSQHAGMVFEFVQGEGGFHPGSREFFVALMDILRDNRVAIIADEVQTFGRTTELFAYQLFGLDRYVDVVTIGKLAQVCATLFTAEFTPQPGLLSQTFTSSTVAIRAARVMVKGLIDGGYFGEDGRIVRLHEHFVMRLRDMERRLPNLVAGPYGIGAMIAFTPLGGDPDKVKRFVHALFDEGVIVFYCGLRSERVRFLIPVAAVTFEHIDEVCSIVERTLLRIAGTS